MLFERIAIKQPGAYAYGWIADPEGVYHEARRGFGGQARTADRLLESPAFHHVRCIGWVANLKATRRGAGALALQSLLARLFDDGADIVGLIAVPDDDIYLPRLVDYYRRFGLEVVDVRDSDYGEHGVYPVMLLRP